MKRRELLSRAGLRHTKQRELIVGILQDRGGHMDADEVYRIARSRRPDISLSTVYRTLRSLKENRLIDEHSFDEEHHHYEVHRSSHHHMVCSRCGAVVEFTFPLESVLREHVEELREVSVESAQLSMTGLCSRCRNETQESSE